MGEENKKWNCLFLSFFIMGFLQQFVQHNQADNKENEAHFNKSIYVVSSWLSYSHEACSDLFLRLRILRQKVCITEMNIPEPETLNY